MSNARLDAVTTAPPGWGVRSRAFRVVEYHRMIETGILSEDDRIELLEGVIVEMSPQGEAHARVITRLTRALVRALGDEFEVRPQLPLTFADSEPEPDLAVVRVDAAAEVDAHPRSALLVIEVSGESLAHDRSIKARVYARSGVPEYWIVNLVARCVEVHRTPEPDAGRYGRLETVALGGRLSPGTLPSFTLDVASLFD